jgi:hypothetical protein
MSILFIYHSKYNFDKEALKEEIRLKKAGNKKYLEWYINSMGL